MAQVEDPANLARQRDPARSEALVPVDEELQALISEQQQRILERYHSGTVLFPRATKNPDGRMPVGSPTYRLGLYRWLADCDIRDEHGRPVHLTPPSVAAHTRDNPVSTGTSRSMSSRRSLIMIRPR
jgi:hypothetical protein